MKLWISNDARLFGRLIEASSWAVAREIAWQVIGDHGAPLMIAELSGPLLPGNYVIHSKDEMGHVEWQMHEIEKAAA